MSDFKFACPVCGQHVTASSADAGQEISCPTCFQRMVVPQPRASDSKLVFTATRVRAPRDTHGSAGVPVNTPRRTTFSFSTFLLVVLLCGLVAALAYYRDRLWVQPHDSVTPHEVSAPPTERETMDHRHWGMDPTRAHFSGEAVSGRVHGFPFHLEKATVQGGHLALRQGSGWPPDLGVSVHLRAARSEELVGQIIMIAPNQPAAPALVLRWKEDGHAVTAKYTNGYAMKLAFGSAQGTRLSGQIWLSAPDSERSFVSGTFQAEIRPPQPSRRTSTSSQPARPGSSH